MKKIFVILLSAVLLNLNTAYFAVFANGESNERNVSVFADGESNDRNISVFADNFGGEDFAHRGKVDRFYSSLPSDGENGEQSESPASTGGNDEGNGEQSESSASNGENDEQSGSLTSDGENDEGNGEQSGLFEVKKIRADEVYTPIVPGGNTYSLDWMKENSSDWLIENGMPEFVHEDGNLLIDSYSVLAEFLDAVYLSEADFLPIDNGSGYMHYGYITGFEEYKLKVTEETYEEQEEKIGEFISLLNCVFIDDNPQYYFFNGFLYSYSTNLDNETMTITAVMPYLHPDYTEYEFREEIQTELDKKFLEYKNLVGTVDTPYDKVRLMHDKMCAETDYAFDPDGDPSEVSVAHNILGAFLDFSSNPDYAGTDVGPVCEAFSEGMTYLINRLDIPEIKCRSISGASTTPDGITGLHGWNVVSLDGGKTFYYVDVTYDNIDYWRGLDYGNDFNYLIYWLFLVGSDNLDYGDGVFHEPADMTGKFNLYQVPLPTISKEDYTVPSEYTYLTDNGYNGHYSSSTNADNKDYVIWKSDILMNSDGGTDGNPLFYRYDPWTIYLYDGPYFYTLLDGAGDVDTKLYKWYFFSQGDGTKELFPNGSELLIKGVDYTVVADLSRPLPLQYDGRDAYRVWLTGIGKYRGIDFVLGKAYAPVRAEVSLPQSVIRVPDKGDVTISPSVKVVTENDVTFEANSNLNWYLIGDNGDGKVSVDPVTGVITVKAGAKSASYIIKAVCKGYDDVFDVVYFSVENDEIEFINVVTVIPDTDVTTDIANKKSGKKNSAITEVPNADVTTDITNDKSDIADEISEDKNTETPDTDVAEEKSVEIDAEVEDGKSDSNTVLIIAIIVSAGLIIGVAGYIYIKRKNMKGLNLK